MRKTIIILTWNCLNYTKQCLASLKNTVDEETSVIVSDNGSNDGTIEYLRGLDWVTVIENGENLGFVRGNNTAIETVTEGDIVLLNNDILISQDDWLEKLERCAYSADDIGVVGCRLKNEDGLLLHTGTEIYPETYWGQQTGSGQRDIGQYPKNRDVQGVVFACAYIKRAVLDKIGGLNEGYVSYFEDTDYCFRAHEAGYRIVCCGEVTLIHYQNVSTKRNNVDFDDLFQNSQNVFKSIWSKKLEDRYTRRLAWHSIMNFTSGYAVSARNFVLALDRQDVDIRYKYVYGEGTPFPVLEHKLGDSYLANLITDRAFDTECVQVVYAQGDVFQKNSGKYKIGFTMLETTGIPKEWVRQCNMMDEVWVPSSFNVGTFRNSGVTVPIYAMPLGIDPNYYNPKIKTVKRHRKYTFLSVFEWGERKAPEILLRAFSRAFTRNDDVVLVCKIINMDGSVDIRRQIRNLCIDLDNSPEIVILYNTSFSDYEMPVLYRSADCFVTATRGEGWGMPILEAMACGLPAIATNWSSQTDFFNEANGYPIRVKRLIDAKAKCPYYEGFQWADPDEDHLVELFRYVYEHQGEAKQKGVEASREVSSKWTWDESAKKIIERLDKIER